MDPPLFEAVTPSDVKPVKIKQEPISHFVSVKEEPVAEANSVRTVTSPSLDQCDIIDNVTMKENMEDDPSRPVEKKNELRRSGRLQEKARKRSIENDNRPNEPKRKVDETHHDFYVFCAVCSLRFLAKHKQELEEHQRSHNGFDCLLCHIDRGSREKLEIHMALIHSNIISPDFKEKLNYHNEKRYREGKKDEKIDSSDISFGFDKMIDEPGPSRRN
ncbi:hypothetical protein PMAYCL1PPCAC_27873 [Pristionchus mayeri]|uniref:Uncharacterized protein n=1 Tax=Pristionchus mayeri TaxID=1317129 RepID=A0AAN5D6J1_9BILA|nr:hypothetical protein PMAYCL1PPCAC_27873 [Pristionchus mayeri]